MSNPKGKAEGLEIPTLGAKSDSKAPAAPAAGATDAAVAERPVAEAAPVTLAQVEDIATKAAAAAAAQAADLAITKMMERMNSAKNNPVHRLNETFAESTTPDDTLHVPLTGDISDLDRTDQVVEPSAIDDATRLKEKAEKLAFMEQKMLILLHESTNPNDSQVVGFAVNGSWVYITRGVKTVVKRKYVERIARCKPHDVKLQIVKHADGEVSNGHTKSYACAYPFSVLHDPHPRGGAWLEAILREK